MRTEKGLKKQVELLLMAVQLEPPLTMGQVMARANIPKTNASDVSSALYKLIDEGLVAFSRGPSTSSKGPKIVRRYQWAVKVSIRRAELPVSPMSGLGVFRI